MAIEYQNKSEVSVGTAQTSITIPVPTGFSAGDLLIACIVMDSNSYLYYHGTPAGWTLLQQSSSGGTRAFGIWYRIAEVGDTEWTWTITASGSFQQYGVILRYIGQAETGFIHDSDITVSDLSTLTPTAPDVAYTDLEAGSLCLQVFGADDDDTPYTTPVQLTERYNGISNTGDGTCGSAGGDKVVSGTGSTGTAEFTMNAIEQWIAVTVVIEAQQPPIEIAGVINGVATVDGDIGIATLPQYAHILHRWKLDEESGTRSDFIGSCDLADNNTVLYGTGKLGNGADFEASLSEYLSATAGDSADMDFTDSNFSISFWVRPETLPHARLLWKQTTGKGWQLTYDTTLDQIILYIYQAGAYQDVTSNTDIINAGVLTHITIVRNGNTGYIYKNGVDDTSASDTLIDPVASAQPLYIGSSPTPDKFVDGIIDELIVWNVALSPAEVSTLFNWYNKLHGTINGVSQLEGLLKTDYYILGNINGVSQISGDLKGDFLLLGTINALSQITGKLVGVVLIDGQIQALSEINGQIIIGKYIAGNINAISQISGNLTGIFYLIGEVQGISTITGLPHIIKILKGTIAGQSVIIGILQDADKWFRSDRDTSQFDKTSRSEATFTKTSRVLEYFFDFSYDDGNWTLSNATISGGILDITASGGYGQRSPDADWHSGANNDFIIEYDYKLDTDATSLGRVYLYLVGDNYPIEFNIYGNATDEYRIRYDGVTKASGVFNPSIDTWYQARIRRVGTTYYFRADDSLDEISWDYGTEREINLIQLVMHSVTGDFDNFKYSPVILWSKQTR